MLARAAVEEPFGVGHPALELVEPALGDPDAARVPVVDEDRRPAGLEVEIRREPADVPPVAHRPERQHRDQRVLGGVKGAEQPWTASLPVSIDGSGQNQTASVSKVCGGRSRAQRSICSPVAIERRW